MLDIFNKNTMTVSVLKNNILELRARYMKSRHFGTINKLKLLAAI